jgi:transcriptional regulator
VAKAVEVAREQRVEIAFRAMVMRREGYGWQDIANRLNVSILEAQEVARVAYATMTAQAADDLRTEVEDRIDAVVKKANLDLSLAESQGERTAIYRVLLAAEAQRSRLLGLDMPKGAHDA